mmetsp:Transcript_5281/g.6663  ORF Transcript_5281/g.6663 Transcript_5281/m.6663 type:complete len:81 (+) Transcript_5281:1766-2008(+)
MLLSRLRKFADHVNAVDVSKVEYELDLQENSKARMQTIFHKTEKLLRLYGIRPKTKPFALQNTFQKVNISYCQIMHDNYS